MEDGHFISEPSREDGTAQCLPGRGTMGPPETGSASRAPAASGADLLGSLCAAVDDAARGRGRVVHRVAEPLPRTPPIPAPRAARPSCPIGRAAPPPRGSAQHRFAATSRPTVRTSSAARLRARQPQTAYWLCQPGPKGPLKPLRHRPMAPGASAAHEMTPRGSGRACRDGLEVGCRMVAVEARHLSAHATPILRDQIARRTAATSASRVRHSSTASQLAA